MSNPPVLLPGDYRPGAIVSVPVPSRVGKLDHKGVVSDRFGEDGFPMVIHASHHFGVVLESTMSVFAMRGVGPVRSEGYPGSLYASEVLERARAQIGTKWTPTRNCEHFVAGAHGLALVSPQLHMKVVEGIVTLVPTVATAWTVKRALTRKAV